MSDSPYRTRLTALATRGGSELLAAGLIGLEREALRVNPQGSLAQTPHPHGLGSALTHPWITTDYAESMPEFVTPACASADEALAFLQALQQYSYRHLGEEFLWGASMPCVVAGETSIPLARYGSSNRGQMKTVYRRGLGFRYGRTMQVIAGLHFNYSVAEALWPRLAAIDGHSPQAPLRDYIDARYMGLTRNLQRLGWLVPYLFGCSPAICKSFLHGKTTDLAEFDPNTYYEPNATSLRMGDIGYQNNKEAEVGIKACYDDLQAYTESLIRACNSPCPRYQAIGVKVGQLYRQLNANILQIENEYYSTVRPKQPPLPDEKPALALQRRGIRYVELRSLDINLFEPLGTDLETLHFLEAFLLYCLLSPSPPIDRREQSEIDSNELLVAHRGRDPALRLQRQGELQPLRDWAGAVFDELAMLCRLLDQGHDAGPYQQALAQQRRRLLNPGLTPSALSLADMRERGLGFYHLGRHWSERHRDWFRQAPVDPVLAERIEAESRASLRRQAEVEAADRLTFDEFLASYFAQGAGTAD